MTHRWFVLGALLFLAGPAAHAQRNTLSFPDTSGRTGQELVIPLQSNFQDQVTGMALTVLFDPNVVRITEVSLAQATSSFTLQTNLTAGRLQAALASTRAVAGTGPVLTLRVRLIGPPGTASLLDLALAVLNEGAFTVSRRNGLVSVVREARILGGVFYRSSMLAVPGVAITATEQASGAVQRATTDANGGYLMGAVPLGNYRLTIAREESAPRGISPLDAAEILRYLVGLIALSADQQKSADVSGNGAVGTSDAALILRYLVGLETAFPAGPFWQFQPDRVAFSLLEDRFQNFTALLLGDVNGDWTASAPAARQAAAGPRLRLLEPVRQPEGIVRFALGGEDLQAVQAGQLRLSYDPGALEIQAVRATGLAADFLTAVDLDRPGQVEMAFAGVQPLDGSGELFAVDFRERGPQGQATALGIDAAALNEGQLAAGDLDRRTYILGGGQDGLPAVAELEPNYPNPFNSATTLRYRTAASGAVRLAIFSVSGQQVKSLVDGRQAAGSYAVVWDGTDDQGAAVSTGVYLVRLRAGEVVQTGRLLLLK